MHEGSLLYPYLSFKLSLSFLTLPRITILIEVRWDCDVILNCLSLMTKSDVGLSSVAVNMFFFLSMVKEESSLGLCQCRIERGRQEN